MERKHRRAHLAGRLLARQIFSRLGGRGGEEEEEEEYGGTQRTRGSRGSANTFRKQKVHYSLCKQEDELRVDRESGGMERKRSSDRVREKRGTLRMTIDEKKQGTKTHNLISEYLQLPFHRAHV